MPNMRLMAGQNRASLARRQSPEAEVSISVAGGQPGDALGVGRVSKSTGRDVGAVAKQTRADFSTAPIGQLQDMACRHGEPTAPQRVKRWGKGQRFLGQKEIVVF